MKVSYNWIKQYVNVDMSADEISELLTDTGLEVEGIEKFQSIKGGLEGLVIGEVKEKSKHPEADRLSLTKVDVGGDELLDIVCGAPNVDAGQKVVVATVGAKLYDGDKEFVIKKSKIRGQVSLGMICAEDEIGVGTSHDGIMVLPNDVKVGTPAKEYFDIEDDVVFEIGITPNRSDALSHIGVARDIAAVLNLKEEARIEKPSVDDFKVDNNDLVYDVIVDEKATCLRYSGLTLSGLTIAESPEWLQNRLKAIGLKPVNNVVDATNYVLHETGQPLHAFDSEKINGDKIYIRKLARGTKMTTLDEVEREMSGNDLVICDENSGMCLAGVFGGKDSGVSETTKDIFLECAHFCPVSVRKTSRYHQLSTDSSFRFERGTDPNEVVYVLKRAAMLIKEVAGGTISSDIVDVYPEKAERVEIDVLYRNVDRLIGQVINYKVIFKIIEGLGMEIIEKDDAGFKVAVPTFKVDVTREADVIEEILRIYGMNNIDISTKIKSAISPIPKPNKEKVKGIISDFLANNGFNEIMNNSLTKADNYIGSKTFNEESNVNILNALSSELNTMRQTLLYGGLETVAYNINRKNADLKLFEFGKTYHKIDGKYVENEFFSIFLTGKKEQESWDSDKANVDFYYLKGLVCKIITRAGVDASTLTIEKVDSDFAEYGLNILSNGKKLVEMCKPSAEVLSKFDIDQDVFFANLNWDVLVSVLNIEKSFKEIVKYPEVRRDLALLVNKDVEFIQIRALAFQTERKLLKNVGIFDVYEGKNLEEGKKSYAVSFILQDENKTLNDKIIDKTMNKFINVFKDKLGAEVR